MTTAEQRKAKSAYVVQDASSSYKDGKAGDNKVPSQNGVVQINEMGSNDSKIKGLLPEGKHSVLFRLIKKWLMALILKVYCQLLKKRWRQRAWLQPEKLKLDAPVVALEKPTHGARLKACLVWPSKALQKDYRQQQQARDKVNRFVKIKVKSFIKKALQTARDTYSAGKSTEFVSETAYQRLPPEVSQSLLILEINQQVKRQTMLQQRSSKGKNHLMIWPEEKTSKLLSTNLISGVHDAKKDSSR